MHDFDYRRRPKLTKATPNAQAQRLRKHGRAHDRLKIQESVQASAQVSALWALLWRFVQPCYVNAALFVNVREVVLFATQDRHPRCHLLAKLPRKYALQGVKS